MKKYILIFMVTGGLSFSSCNRPAGELPEEEVSPQTLVEITNIQSGSVDDALVLFATTVYLKRNSVSAPISAYITNVRSKLGDIVNAGDVLYELESKERRALGNNLNQLDSSLKSFGIIMVKATASGVISTMDKQLPGDYVLEGAQLCTISASGDLAFQVNVPYEFTPFTKTGKHCTIILPDNSVHQASFTKSLTSMNTAAQTQTILAVTRDGLTLPENMIVKVEINKNTVSNKQILPKGCVLSDEMMKEFWVMKLINDSTAVKIPVDIGNRNSEKIEILSPVFNPGDKIISIGNYGLMDTAIVKVVKKQTQNVE